jgi:8-oxo-dGTP pyrophosphatase MutT (NUDIX family)
VSLQPWAVHARRVLHQGQCRVEEHDVETPEGRRFAFPVLYMGGFAKVLPVTRTGHVVFVRQYRHALGRVTLELPAGAIGPGETPRDAAVRELAEEAGLAAGHVEDLGSFVTSPGRISERGWVFMATDCVPDPAAQPDEPTEPVEVPLAEALALIGDRVEDAATSLALLLARDRLTAIGAAGSVESRPWTTG